MNVYVETYGCTANKSDERLVHGLLKREGHEIVYNLADADVLILLSCTVIEATEQRMLSRLKVFKKTQKKIVVSGCMPVVQAELIKSIVPNVYLLPPQYIQYINDVIKNNKPVHLESKKTILSKYYETAIAPVMIAEGCQLSCSYCITRFARGVLRSYSIQDIRTDIRSAIKQGCKEIQLTAQDTASYGFDIGTNLGKLLMNLCKIDGSYRIRVGMMNPLTVQKNLESIINAFQQNKIYKFLHLPVQSGDDTILKAMNRGYTALEFIKIVEQFRKKISTLTLSTDIIVGFPTETEEQFYRTVELLKQIKPDIINITKFSARILTAAKSMKGRIPTHEVKERSKWATEICSKISYKKNKEHLNKIYTVLLTEKGKRNTYKGRTENYKQVVLTEPVTIGDFVRVKIIDAAPTYLVGKLI